MAAALPPSDPVELKQPPELSQEQQQVVDAVCYGDNVFFTGLPGTGKSFTLCAVIDALRQRMAEGELAICASTGSAACHIGGGTVHSFLGCGLGKRPEDFDRMRHAEVRLCRAKVLVIDEISMLSGEFMERASKGLAKVRRRETPFGGLQMVLCGDFLQLPPITGCSGSWRFAFQAPCWEELELRNFELKENFRQADDVCFQALLRRVRIGRLTESDRMMLTNSAAVATNPAVMQTTLLCRNVDVERQNHARLAQLPGQQVAFHATDTLEGGMDASSLQRILEKSNSVKTLLLKIGAPVMLLRNLRTPSLCKHGQVPLVNGSVGQVIGFEPPNVHGEVLPVIDFGERCRVTVGFEQFTGSVPGMGKYMRRQLPLKLAWAVSVHKSQGMTLQGGTVDLNGAFEEGQVYVALSRFRSAAALVVRSLPQQIRVSHAAWAFHERLTAAVEGTKPYA